jgi:hypothetical protein
MAMYYAKVYKKKDEVLLAVCDKDIHNKTFENEKLRFFVDPAFYGGEEKGEDELLELFDEATVINLAGKTCVNLAIRAGYVDPQNVIDIDTCTHAQVIRI